MQIERLLAYIASAITIGYAIPYIAKFLAFLFESLFRKQLLEGVWHSYHFTRRWGRPMLRHEKWMIKRNVLNRLTVKTEDLQNPGLKYKGVIAVERNYLLILLRGVRHKEEIQMRFFDIIPSGEAQDQALGLAMGVDFNNRSQCILRIMSRRELSNDEAERILRSKVEFTEPGIMSISEWTQDT